MWLKVSGYVDRISSTYDCAVRSSRQRRPPKSLEDSVILESTGSRFQISSTADYKTELYYPVLDAEICRRFDQKNLGLMNSIQACNLKSSTFLHPASLNALVNNYNFDKDTVALEATLALKTLSGKELHYTSDVLLALQPLKEAFPNLFKVIKIAMTISVSTAQCERTFSTLKLLKTYLRSTISEDRLSDLAVLAVEKEISTKINLDEVVTQFAKTEGLIFFNYIIIIVNEFFCFLRNS